MTFIRYYQGKSYKFGLLDWVRYSGYFVIPGSVPYILL